MDTPKRDRITNPTRETPPRGREEMAERAKELVTRLFEQVLNAGDYQVVDELIAPNFTDDDPNLTSDIGPGPAAFAACSGTMATAVPDATFTIDQMVAEGNRVAVRWTVSNGDYTNSGSSFYLTNPETGQILSASTRWDAGVLQRAIGEVPLAALNRARGTRRQGV